MGSVTGVVLLNMGGPSHLGEIQPFLQQLLSDQDLVSLPIPSGVQSVLARIVSYGRAKSVRKYYEEIGGGSPLARLTELQRSALQEALGETGKRFLVYAAMRYGEPSIRVAVAKMIQDGVDRIMALPLYPQYCRATTGSSFKELRRCLNEHDASLPTIEVRSWCDHPGYVATLAALLARELARCQGKKTHVLFCAHNIPRRLVQEGDPYAHQVSKTVCAVVDKNPGYAHSLAYQSRVGWEKWLSPDVKTEVRRLGQEGVEALVIVPVSFASDNLETLHELDIRLSAQAAACGIKTFLRVPALNDSLTFIWALKNIVLTRLETAP